MAVPFDPAAITAKYTLEKEKRLRPDGASQFTPLAHSPLSTLAADPWVNHSALNAQTPCLKDGQSTKFLILGAGYGGLLLSVRLIEAGVSADQIRIIDNAGGWGGTWYWNRYPGLHCDVESYIYMPLLEETGYVPKKKYAPGEELREHAERIATKWELDGKALFRSEVKGQVWDEGSNVWKVDLKEDRGPGEGKRDLTVEAEFVLVASGLFPNPQVPKLEGLDMFKGSVFHTARWNYEATGGSPADPTLERLAGKRVGILGTGATAIQVVPRLAESPAASVTVFQRTASSVDERGNKPTDVDNWEKDIATGKGWQKERMKNFNAFTTRSEKEGSVNMVDDAWTRLPSYCAVLGSTRDGIITREKVPGHVGRLYREDFGHMERVRARVDGVVMKDEKTREGLKAWYNSWCKRPAFSDEYLQAFNKETVELVDTEGKGVEKVTETGVVVAGKEYPIDVLVLSTGYTTPGVGNGSPAVRTSITITGRGGADFDEKWQNAVATLYGVMSSGFPNLFFIGPSQIGSAANNVFVLDMLAEHITYIVSEAEKTKGKDGKRVTIECTREGEEAWAGQIMMRAGWYAGISGCTPGYLNGEGHGVDGNMTPEAMMKFARMAGWAEGPNSFAEVIRGWREKGGMEGIVVKAVEA